MLQVIVDGMRVRVRLDQQRIASLLQGITPQAMGTQFADVASGVLSMLGDMAALSFARYHPGVSPTCHFLHSGLQSYCWTMFAHISSRVDFVRAAASNLMTMSTDRRHTTSANMLDWLHGSLGSERVIHALM